ncbi:DUF4917 family protein [Tautonia sp. JC769]|uniref:DUF4917 family protein n=1 Tax=Tautonia sp. JC769 TaxID=3232135 RepID=UPI00345B08DB
MTETLSFNEALSLTAHQKRHLLLGNGFSISLFPGCFHYGSLLEEADFSDIPEVRQAFDLLKTSDFESVIHALRQTMAILPLYHNDSELCERLNLHAERLKDIFVRTIAGKHPARPSEITDAQYRSCREFLSYFAGERRTGDNTGGRDLRGYICTLNYDMLLYWTSMHDRLIHHDNEGNPSIITLEALQHDDGFRSPEDEPEAEYVTWDGEEAYNQCIYYLHGALHLYDYGSRLQKLCWERSGGKPLIDQIRQSLDDGRFPLFVSEGHTDEKFERIRHSGYLHTGLRKFRGACNTQNHTLFIFGHSLAENDAHIFRQISKGRLRSLYVSLYGDPDSEGNLAIRRRAELIAGQRSERYPLEVTFYDAASANVWGN